MTFNKSALAASISLVTLALAGCGGGSGSQDSGSSASNVTLSGLVVDPYVAQAKVYVDLNNDGIHQFSTEDFAYTDKDGYFSKSKPDANGISIDYCAEGNVRYCLNTSQVSDSAVLRIEGGYDIATGQAFTGSMEMPLTLNGSDQQLGTANPLISLFTAASTSQENAILDFIDPSVAGDALKRATLKAELTQDFLSKDSNGAAGVDPEKFRRAMQIHKAAAILSSALEHKYSLKADALKVNGILPPASAGKFVYAAIAQMLADKSTPVIADWEAALTASDAALQPTTGKPAAEWAANEKTAIAARVSQLFNWFDANKSPLTTGANNETSIAGKQESLYRYARVADFAVGQVKREVKSNSVQNQTNASQTVAGQVLTQISGNTDTFKITDFNSQVDLDNMVNQTTLPKVVPKLPIEGALFVAPTMQTDEITVSGKVIKLNYAEPMSANKTGQANIYFIPSPKSTLEGRVALCVRATEDSSDLKDIKGLDKGVLLTGYWNKLTDFSVNIAITEPISPKQALIVKRTVKASPLDTYQFSLDTASGLETWQGTISHFLNVPPRNDAECVSALTVQ
ncbi:hypothetical protein SAMN02745127_02125 [Oceanospirillum multiglobuliferum]|uniref:Lipoprotein n=1 Tax=Oceanospirillum multiglobuliferum TaxID=64969 RepID=A0A1T4R2W7_9GAMM|nr:hypothetical protein [Oceanospirillum multiglobuliferum]OPX55273.1 hypothetical protein BTE48_10105 [Oceanospirillum multiglobuliferum]SKA10394.1 hypothetical protein SAMN02745127_02125 [Oceanospirillum multiglobuliferum]